MEKVVPVNRSERSGLQVDEHLRSFVEDELLSEVELDAKDFWSTLARLQERFAPRIADALARRDDVQARIDAWHGERGVGSRDDYETLLTELGYLAPEPSSAPTIDVDRVDPEIAEVPGPQLVVPSTNARFALNAANARWGSLFDAFYGTDALPQDHELAKGYDERRGAQVIEAADELLDELFPLATGSHRDVTAYRPSTDGLVADTLNHGTVGLADPSQFAGFNAGGDTGNVLLVRNGLHVDLVIDPTTQVGRQHHADVSDVVLESAVTTIVDLEDSVATVDGEDKALAYRTWLGLMTGNLVSEFQKGGETVTRRVNPDREYTGVDGNPLTLQGRSMMLVRNCGHHMTTTAVLTADGQEVAEGVLDALVSAVAGVYDLQGIGPHTNSRAGSIYIVKPKQHGPEEVALTVELFAAVEEALGLDTNTIKIGIMDEEKRTTLNLSAAIGEAVNRVIFVNTGFLDRTGDEIHTCFAAGPVLRKGDMKSTTWLQTYEDRNVDVALEAGFSHRAQIGKGMWAKPAAMAEMLEQKIGQPKAGANTAWVPSPTAATLHALHYLRTDVHAVQSEIAKRDKADRRKLLELPVDAGVADLSDEDKRYELETNAQSMLGYVVRWVGMGIGCSTVPDLEGTGLMEDRATLRISSQLIANWLEHGVVDSATVRDTFERMAALVDEQNAGEPGYPPMAPDPDNSESFQAALELVFEGKREPNGYTERALTKWRQKAKART